MGGCDTLKLRVFEIEDRLGLFYVAVLKISSRCAVKEMTLFCQELFGPGLSMEDFSVVRELVVRRAGVLSRVSSLVLK